MEVEIYLFKRSYAGNLPSSPATGDSDSLTRQLAQEQDISSSASNEWFPGPQTNVKELLSQN